MRYKPKKNILISGWYGFGNLGDEAILSAIEKNIILEIPNTNIQALTFNPSFTERFQGIKAHPQFPVGIKRWIRSIFSGDIIRTIAAVYRCDLFILGGGGFLSDWQPEAPWVWLRQALLARIFGKKVMIYGIGAGPFMRRFGSWITKTIINNCVQAVTVRDEESKQWLTKVGVKEELVQVTADPAIRFPLQISTKKENPKKIGICVGPIFNQERYWPGKRYKYNRYIEALRSIVEMLIGEGFEVLFIPMQESSDLALAHNILKGGALDVSILHQPARIEDAVSLISQADILIAMRCHAAILGTLQNIPVAGIIYHHKVSEFLASVGLSTYAEEIGDGSNWRESDIDPERMVNNIKLIAKNYDYIVDTMSKRIADIQIKERDNIKTLIRVMNISENL